ncbi:hypothetical protein IAG41_04235 [Sphingomonas sp. JC676]|uniref:hypothetical protein n=1 Tax=Sphingomonas sp. JC676 TaxID=2768065 RepID=UPI0016586147|nr:hypothetical protein [Sphingomonas sp. JC676]MBC9031594.1 hypothetical protein [Sphingomonas sp. JC676]
MSNGTTSVARTPATKKSAATDTIGDNPAVLLAGGVALGVLIGMLLPRLERERKALDPVGKKLAERATAAVKAAKETGREEIDSLLPARDATRERVSALFGNIIDAAKGANAKV